jgi:hypothetical protein
LGVCWLCLSLPLMLLVYWLLVGKDLLGVCKWGLRRGPSRNYGSLRACRPNVKAECSHSSCSRRWLRGLIFAFHGTCRPNAKAVYLALGWEHLVSGGTIPCNLPWVCVTFSTSSHPEDRRPCRHVLVELREH